MCKERGRRAENWVRKERFEKERIQAKEMKCEEQHDERGGMQRRREKSTGVEEK